MLGKITVAVSLAITTAHAADCYVRSAVTSRSSLAISHITDVESWVVPVSAAEKKCMVTFRAQVNGQWITAESEKTGPRSWSESQLCAGAVDQERIRILSRASGSRMTVENNMVCDERPAIQVRTVALGERIRESEVLPHPNFPKPFVYRTAQCKWFIEPEVQPGRDLLQRQGIICQLNPTQWQVVDKW